MDLKHYPRQWWVKGRLLVRIPETFVDLQLDEGGAANETLSGKKNFYRLLARHIPKALAELEAERPKAPPASSGSDNAVLGAGFPGVSQKQTKAQKALAKREAKKKEKEKGKKGKKKKKGRRR